MEIEATRATDAETALSGRITVNAESIAAEVTRATGAEGTLSSRITATAEDITAEVTRATAAETALSGRITVNAESIAAEVTRATGAEGTLSSRITTTAEDITTEVTRATNAEMYLSGRITTNATAISAKVSQTGGSASSFAWSLVSTGFTLTSNNTDVMKVTSSGLEVVGKITATSGTLGNLTVTGRLYFGGNDNYYIDANNNDASYYINLPGLRIDEANGAVFSGKLSAATGTFSGSLSAATGSFSGSISASSGSIGNLLIKDGYIYFGTTEGTTTTGIKITTDTIYAKNNYSSYGAIGGWNYGSYLHTYYFDSTVSSYCEPRLKSENLAFYEQKIGYETSSCTWRSLIYTISTVANASDSRVKNSIEELPEEYEVLFDNLRPKRYKYNDGTSGRFHTGFVAQDVVEALEMAGLTTTHFAGVMLDHAGQDGEQWYLRRDEFVSLNTWEIQKLKARVAELERKLST